MEQTMEQTKQKNKPVLCCEECDELIDVEDIFLFDGFICHEKCIQIMERRERLRKDFDDEET